jgi:hypothetical protein
MVRTLMPLRLANWSMVSSSVAADEAAVTAGKPTECLTYMTVLL